MLARSSAIRRSTPTSALARVAPRHGRVHRLVLAQVRRQVAGHRSRLPARCRRPGAGASRPKARGRSSTYGFDDLGLDRIIGVTHPGNKASQRVLMKAGLEDVGWGRYYDQRLRLFVAENPDR